MLKNPAIKISGVIVLLILLLGISTWYEHKKLPKSPPLPSIYKRSSAVKKYTTEPVISVLIHETGEVRYMKIEEYLEGVVAAEMEAMHKLRVLLLRQW